MARQTMMKTMPACVAMSNALEVRTMKKAA